MSRRLRIPVRPNLTACVSRQPGLVATNSSKSPPSKSTSVTDDKDTATKVDTDSAPVCNSSQEDTTANSHVSEDRNRPLNNSSSNIKDTKPKVERVVRRTKLQVKPRLSSRLPKVNSQLEAEENPAKQTSSSLPAQVAETASGGTQENIVRNDDIQVTNEDPLLSETTLPAGIRETSSPGLGEQVDRLPESKIEDTSSAHQKAGFSGKGDSQEETSEQVGASHEDNGTGCDGNNLDATSRQLRLQIHPEHGSRLAQPFSREKAEPPSCAASSHEGQLIQENKMDSSGTEESMKDGERIMPKGTKGHSEPTSRRAKLQVRPNLGQRGTKLSTARTKDKSVLSFAKNSVGMDRGKAADSRMGTNVVSLETTDGVGLQRSDDSSLLNHEHSKAAAATVTSGSVLLLADRPPPLTEVQAKEEESCPVKKQKRPVISLFPTDKLPDRSKMRMRDLIYWNPSTNLMASPTYKKVKTDLEECERKKDVAPVGDENKPIPTPQVKIGPDGNIIINEESLVISNPQEKELNIAMEVVDETEMYTNYGSFRKFQKAKMWTDRETKRFYLALSTVGTDFTLMNRLFPERNRRQLKNKFKREEKINRRLVDKAIKERRHFDMSLFEPSESEEEEAAPKKRTKAKSLADKKKGKLEITETQKLASKRKKRKIKKYHDNSSGPDEEADVGKEVVLCEGKEDDRGKVSTVQEEMVVEEAVHDEMLIVDPSSELGGISLENSCDGLGGRMKSRTGHADDCLQGEEEVVASILMEMGQHQATVSNKAQAHGADTSCNVIQNLKMDSVQVRNVLQQLGISNSPETLGGQVQCITEAEISNNDLVQKVLLVEVKNPERKDSIVHMFLVSPGELDGDSSVAVPV